MKGRHRCAEVEIKQVWMEISTLRLKFWLAVLSSYVTGCRCLCIAIKGIGRSVQT